MTEATEAQATDEAVLLMIRKLRRLEPAAYARIMEKMPQGGRNTLIEAERRADVRRSTEGLITEWPVPEWMKEIDEDGEE